MYHWHTTGYTQYIKLNWHFNHHIFPPIVLIQKIRNISYFSLIIKSLYTRKHWVYPNQQSFQGSVCTSISVLMIWAPSCTRQALNNWALSTHICSFLRSSHLPHSAAIQALMTLDSKPYWHKIADKGYSLLSWAPFVPFLAMLLRLSWTTVRQNKNITPWSQIVQHKFLMSNTVSYKLNFI